MAALIVATVIAPLQIQLGHDQEPIIGVDVIVETGLYSRGMCLVCSGTHVGIGEVVSAFQVASLMKPILANPLSLWNL